MKLFLLVSGVRVPVLAFNGAGGVDQIASGTVRLHSSPFIKRLPKQTKMAVFFQDPEHGDEPLMLIDGHLSSVRQFFNRGGQAICMLSISADAQHLETRNREMAYIETMFSSAAVMRKGEVSDVSVMNVYQPVTSAFSSGITEDEIKGDTCRGAALIATSIYTGTKITYCLNGEFRAKTGEDPISLGTIQKNAQTTFLARFWHVYKFPLKVGYIPMPPELIKAFETNRLWEILRNEVQMEEGNFSYWQIVLNMLRKTKSTWASTLCPHYNGKIIAENMIMQRNLLTKIPVCNVIFPSMVSSFSDSTNYYAEPTRVIGSPGFLNGDSAHSGLLQKTVVSPSGLKGALECMNVGVTDAENGVTKVSEYENQFGSISFPLYLSDALSRHLAYQEDGKEKFVEHLNHEYAHSFLGRGGSTVDIKFNPYITPGFCVLHLRGGGDHTISYCASVAHSIDTEMGNATTTISLMAPRDYSLDMTKVDDISNSLDHHPEKAEPLVGCKMQTESSTKFAEAAFKKWRDDYGCSHSLALDFRKKICTLRQYISFHDGAIIDTRYPTEIPDEWCPSPAVAKKLDTTKEAAELSLLQYRWVDPLTNEVLLAKNTSPDPTKISKAGLLIPSTTALGIVDCHLKWLARLGVAGTI